jgi:hypothetical protein
LESPTERDFRDIKNNNIWGIKELDVRDKPEHNFTTNEPPDDHNNCHGCKKLKQELLRQQ